MRFLSPRRSVLVLAALALGAAGCGTTDDTRTADSAAVESSAELPPDTDAADTDAADNESVGNDSSETTANTVAGGDAENPATTLDDDDRGDDGTTTPTSAAEGQSGDLADRLATYLLENPDGLEIDQEQAACAGQSLAATLPADRMELLVTNLEELDEVEDGRQFSNDERLVIAESFAACLDFSVLVDEVVLDEPSITAVVQCITTEAGPDRVEAVMLAGALGDDVSDPRDSVLKEGLAVCPAAARESLAAYLDERFFETGTDIVACLDGYTDDELVRYVDGTEELFDLADELAASCIPQG